MLFVGVSTLSLFQAVVGQRGQEGVLWTEPNLIHTRQKHNTIIASVSELGDDCPSSRGSGKAKKYDLLSRVFLSFDSCFITGYYYFFFVGCAICWSLYVLGFFNFLFQSSTFHAYFANELEGREAKGRIHAQIIVICYLLLAAKK